MHKGINVEPGQCKCGVRPFLPTEKFQRCGDGSFHGLWVRGDGRRSSSGKWDTRHQLLTGLHRDLQQNYDTVDRVTGGRKWGNIHRWAWCELTFIPLWVERYKCDSSLQQLDFWSSWSFELSRHRFHFPGKCLAKWTWDSLVVYMHFAVAMLIRQSCCILLTAVPCMDEM